MQRNPANSEELKVDTCDDIGATKLVANFFLDDEDREEVLSALENAKPGFCISVDQTNLVLDAFYDLLQSTDRETSVMTRACSRGALEAFDIQPPAEVIQLPVRVDFSPSAA